LRPIRNKEEKEKKTLPTKLGQNELKRSGPEK